MRNPKMNQGFITTLPLEIVLDIIARLPVRTIVSCKCVCKSWLRLVKSHEFAKLHLSKSAPLLAIKHEEKESKLQAYSFFEVEQGLDLQLYFNSVTKFNLPEPIWVLGGISGSVNGLLFLYEKDETHELFLICNPITRQYIQIPYHPPVAFNNREIAFGFGVSRITGQLKVVRIFEESPEFHSEVYTLGTGSWRRTAHPAALKYVGANKHGSFLNGNLHWLVKDPNGYSRISCFDLETELFSTLSTPNSSDRSKGSQSLACLGEFLCLCKDTGQNIIIWLMNEYGVEKSWTMDFAINYERRIYVSLRFINPTKLLDDGGVLIARAVEEDMVELSVHYSKKKEVNLNIIRFKNGTYVSDCILHTPSFHSLESFRMEDVISF